MKTNIEMAREAGFCQEHINIWMCTGEDIKRFADLIRADERERIIKVIESMGTWAHINETIDEVRKNT